MNMEQSLKMSGQQFQVVVLFCVPLGIHLIFFLLANISCINNEGFLFKFNFRLIII